MTKETVFSLIRAIAIGVGAFLVGSNTRIFGNPVDSVLWEAIVGALIAAIATVWAIIDKTATIEATESGIKSFVVFVGGLLVASGKLKAEVLQSLLGIITVLVPVWLSSLNRKKLRKIDNGDLLVTDAPGKVSNNIRKTVVPNKSLAA